MHAMRVVSYKNLNEVHPFDRDAPPKMIALSGWEGIECHLYSGSNVAECMFEEHVKHFAVGEEMAKNTIIAGAPRAGKSTLAKRLCAAHGASYFPMDSLVSTFGRVFPEIGITHYDENHERTCRAFWPFLHEFLTHLEYEDFGFVADVYHLLPEDVAEAGLSGRYDIVFVGYPSADRAEKCRHIRDDARPEDWTSELNDTQLERCVAHFIEQSAAIRDDCARLGLRFVDTSDGFSKALDAAFREMLA
jgi:hypothetical protein